MSRRISRKRNEVQCLATAAGPLKQSPCCPVSGTLIDEMSSYTRSNASHGQTHQTFWQNVSMSRSLDRRKSRNDTPLYSHVCQMLSSTK